MCITHTIYYNTCAVIKQKHISSTHSLELLQIKEGTFLCVSYNFISEYLLILWIWNVK